jgi:hypothetical protein
MNFGAFIVFKDQSQLRPQSVKRHFNVLLKRASGKLWLSTRLVSLLIATVKEGYLP